MSGHPEGIRPEEVNRLGIDGTLSKPFTPVQLLETVKQALRSDLRAREQRG
jgi:DNA-binding NarL/FixJ family response regulator